MKFFLIATLILTAAVIAPAQSESEIESVTLDSNYISEYCPFSASDGGECSKKQAMIKVSVKTKAPTDGKAEFIYMPDAGVMVGSGSDVVWDLRGVPIGKYKLAVAMGQKGVFRGASVSTDMEVRSCSHCMQSCYCKGAVIEGPTGPVAPGDRFIVRSSRDYGETYKDRWTVDSGQIVSDQGRNWVVIEAKTPGKITVTLEIGGVDAACSCPTKFESTYDVKKP